MSNVLIGIIGVILFIGLALAGALFLGPRFQESTNNSRASASVQAVAQVSNAVNMYKVQEGKDATAGAITAATTTPVAAASQTYTDLVGSGYLKSVPSNPTGPGNIVLGATGSTRIVTMDLGGNAQAICKAINKQTTGTESENVAQGTGTQGCSSAAGTYTAWASA